MKQQQKPNPRFRAIERFDGTRPPPQEQVRKRNTCQTFDIQEIMKNEMANEGASREYGNGNFAGNSAGGTSISTSVVSEQTTTTTESAKPSKSQQYDNGIFDTTIHFDSYYRDRTSDMLNGVMSFSISTINSSKAIENVVQIQIDRLYVPTPMTPSGSAELQYFRQGYIQITNISNQQNTLTSTGAFSYEFDITNTNSAASLWTPVSNTITFRQPITQLDTFTMRFMIPPLMKAFPLPNDLMTVQLVVPGTNPARFQIVSVDSTADIGAVGVLAPADQVNVYMYDFTSSNATVNNAVSSTYGVKITNIINSTVFEIGAIDATAIVVAPAVNTMLIGKNRIAITARFRTVTEGRTNYLQAVSL